MSVEQALKKYSDEYAFDINNLLKGDFNRLRYPVDEIQQLISILDTAFTKTGFKGKLYRGTKRPINFTKQPFPAFLSTTTDYKIAEEFRGPTCCIYTFIMADNVPYINMTEEYAYKPEEAEVLLPRNLYLYDLGNYNLYVSYTPVKSQLDAEDISHIDELFEGDDLDFYDDWEEYKKVGGLDTDMPGENPVFKKARMEYMEKKFNELKELSN